MLHPLVLLLLLIVGPSWTRADDPAQVLTLGVYAYRPPEDMQHRFQPLADELTRRLPGIRVELTALPMNLLEQAVASGTVDLVLTNPRHYVALRTRNRFTGVIATLRKRAFDGSATGQLGGVIFTRADRSDLSTLADLKGQRIAVPTATHTGGYLIPLFEFKRAGLPLPSEDRLDIAGTHDAVVERVRSGASDVGDSAGAVGAFARRSPSSASRSSPASTAAGATLPRKRSGWSSRPCSPA